MDIIPFTSVMKLPDLKTSRHESSPINKWDDIFGPNEEAGDWCLFTVDVRNTYGMPFQVTFERSQDGQLSFPGFQSYVLLIDYHF